MADGHHRIHLPGPSATPLVLSLGVALTLAGFVPKDTVWRLTLLSVGVTLAALAGFMWLRHAMAEYRDLPD